jgi:hypothetical protein
MLTSTDALVFVNDHAPKTKLADAPVVHFFQGNLQGVRHALALPLAGGLSPASATSKHLLEDTAMAVTAPSTALHCLFPTLIIQLTFMLVAEHFER